MVQGEACHPHLVPPPIDALRTTSRALVKTAPCDPTRHGRRMYDSTMKVVLYESRRMLEWSGSHL